MTVEVEVGHPLVKLTEACERHECDLLALGTRGTKHGPTQIGTIATKCVRSAPADILLIREGNDAPFRRILACVDFSDNSANVVRSALRLAEDDKAELDCVFVFRGALSRPVDYGGVLQIVPVTAFDPPQGLKEDLKRFLKPIVAESRLEPTCHVLAGGSIRDRIFVHARDSNADIVVLGSHGSSGLTTRLLGTTVENIIKHSPCSVLAVRPVLVAPPRQSRGSPSKEEKAA
jgi:nucleotide-binding universal stress UspA family protein